MVKKLFLRTSAVYFWLCSVLTFVIMIIALFQNPTFSTALLFITMIASFQISGFSLWFFTIKPKEKQIENKEINKNKQTTITDTDVPKETLFEMKKYYSQMQVENDLRILEESVELIKSTKSVETFISRTELAQRKALTLEQAIKAGIKIPSKFISFKELLELKYELVPKLLYESYQRSKNDALKLKTEKGRVGRLQKFYDLLKENDVFFEGFKEYNEILISIENDIKNCTTSNY